MNDPLDSNVDEIDPEVWTIMLKEVRKILVERKLQQQLSKKAEPLAIEFRELSGGSAKCFYCERLLPENMLVYGRPLAMTTVEPYFTCIDCVQHLVFEELIMPELRWQIYAPRERGKRRKKVASGRVKTVLKVPSRKAFREWSRSKP